jgi:hypothetical protein
MSLNRENRFPIGRAGFIVNAEGERYRCEICNISRHGALLRLGDTEWLPNQFELHERLGTKRLVEVRWRTPDYMGVRFLEGSWVPPECKFGRRTR